MSRSWQKVGIIGGGGDLPVRLAEACEARGDAFFVVRLSGYADPALDRFPGAPCGLAEVGRLLSLLKEASCDAVVLAGLVRRPNFAALKPDWRGARLLPKVVSAARRGDGALLDVLVQTFEDDGLTVVGPEEISQSLEVPSGPLTASAPDALDIDDMSKAAQLLDALGPFDVAQGVVLRRGFVLAVEAAEGTDEMLRRVAALPSDLRGNEPGQNGQRAGVLVKRPKTVQARNIDLPTIGVRTVKLAHAAGLSGIAVEAHGALIVDHAAVRDTADRLGVFVYGFTDNELESPE